MIPSIFSIVTIVALALVSFGAEARSIDPSLFTRTAKLTRFQIDPALNYRDDVIAGEISLNAVTKDVVLYLERRYVCRTRICPQVMPAPIVSRLKLVKVVSDKTCNSAMFYARHDRRPVGGDLEVLKITDNSRNTCKYFARIASTLISHQIVTSGQDGAVRRYTSTYEASPLVQAIIENNR